jgi:hypothetical protein
MSDYQGVVLALRVGLALEGKAACGIRASDHLIEDGPEPSLDDRGDRLPRTVIGDDDLCPS